MIKDLFVLFSALVILCGINSCASPQRSYFDQVMKEHEDSYVFREMKLFDIDIAKATESDLVAAMKQFWVNKKNTSSIFPPSSFMSIHAVGREKRIAKVSYYIIGGKLEYVFSDVVDSLTAKYGQPTICSENVSFYNASEAVARFETDTVLGDYLGCSWHFKPVEIGISTSKDLGFVKIEYTVRALIKSYGKEKEREKKNQIMKRSFGF